ncbi:MAG: 6-carboxytetrahydropterin synthase, partial [Nitrospirae bacterium]|nr:6-carboxytetrahydropterin synthase [Nitrospirota bacterium]
IDFHELRNIVNEALSVLEHTNLNNTFPFTEINPSSENIAKWTYESIKKKLNNDYVKLSAVTVWEAETASATYFE